jgi:hypothetical protein
LRPVHPPVWPSSTISAKSAALPVAELREDAAITVPEATQAIFKTRRRA